MQHVRVSSSLLVLAFGIVALLACALASARGHGHGGGGIPGRFDYYLMSLSWSPSFCETHPNETEQCGTKGFGFVLHGLWPQNKNGSWPQDCETRTAPDEATIAHTLAFMPSRHLIEHEWQTHGSCTGLDAKAYFALADDAFSRVTIPPTLNTPKSSPSLSADEIVKAFMAVNPGLEPDMISVACHDGGELEEVRVCLDKDNLSVKQCGGRVRNTCRVGKLTIPASR